MEGTENYIIELWALVVSYPLKDVYNMDETGLF